MKSKKTDRKRATKKAKGKKPKPDPKTGRYPCDQGPLCPTECKGSKNPDGRCHWAPLLDKAYWG